VRITGTLFLATLLCVTWEKVHWNVAGAVGLADVLTVMFLVAFALEWGRPRFPRTTVTVLAIFAALLVIYLIGFFNIETKQSLDQWGKGMVKFVLHFLFLGAGVAYLARRSIYFYWQAVAAFTVGLVVNSAYGVLQLLAARAGTNLDQVLLSPLTGGASSINVYGAIGGTAVYRPNALTSDPNHLAVMLCIPILTLLPVYLRLERGHRLRVPLAVVLGFFFLVMLSTLSRSGLLGLIVGLLVLAIPYRRRLVSRALLVPLAGVAALLVAVVWSRRHYFEVLLKSRVQTGGRSETAHFAVYDFVPQVIHSHPLFGLGLNTFSVYYEFVTGKSNWGPHSFYVALIVEAGLVGAAVFLLFLRDLFSRLRAARALGRRLALEGPDKTPGQTSSLISSTRIESDPSYSPDGKRIVFYSYRTGTSEIWVCNNDGSSVVQITQLEGAPCGTPRWSPGGDEIVFEANPEGHWDIFTVPASGGAAQRLTTQSSQDAIPSWSHDGTWIYFIRERPAAGRLTATPYLRKSGMRRVFFSRPPLACRFAPMRRSPTGVS
jgi:O-antigen ligase